MQNFSSLAPTQTDFDEFLTFFRENFRIIQKNLKRKGFWDFVKERFHGLKLVLSCTVCPVLFSKFHHRTNLIALFFHTFVLKRNYEVGI
jgi:hypothetical protein